MAASQKKLGVGDKSKPSQEVIVAGFNELRQQQRAVASKLSELEVERKEHELVLETLRSVDPGRKGFRLVGGVLVERKVGEILPALETNYSKLGMLVDTITKQLESKGQEINAYRDKYQIQVRDNPGPSDDIGSGKGSSSQGVLVAKES